MTTIIWRKLNDWTLEISWDKRTFFASWKYVDNTTKIIKLDNILLWKAWDAIDLNLIKELYNHFKEQKLNNTKNEFCINSIIDSIEFINYIKSNCNIEVEWWLNTSFMILHSDFQIVIEPSWQIVSIEDSWWILSIWSWSTIVDTIIKTFNSWKIKYKYELEDLYEIVSSIDPYTSKEFDVLNIKINNK